MTSPERPVPPPATGMRLQNALAERGIASRRASAALVQAGRVEVNGVTVREPGTRVDPQRDRVSVDGVPLAATPQKARTLMLNKPVGYVCSAREGADRAPTVMGLLKSVEERVVPVGRLDRDSEGLLLLSNDGDLILRVTHPRYGHTKTYVVEVRGVVTATALAALQGEHWLDGYRLEPVRVTRLTPVPQDGVTRLQFALKEGRNRQIRRMCETVGLKVERLRRVSIQALTLGRLKPGEWRDLTAAEVAALREPAATAAAPASREVHRGRAEPSPAP